MARKRVATPSQAARSTDSVCGDTVEGSTRSASQLFSRMACRTAAFSGHPLAFALALGSVLLWAATGPLFGFSDTWQLVINTSTTIITFLMVFLIQHTQNRDTLAIQVKLAELIIAGKDAQNRLATVEDLSEEELRKLHDEYREQAETVDRLARRKQELKRVS
ncbi:MAG: low affinity iron permease family protein [Xanthobacteraceae bacterium]